MSNALTARTCVLVGMFLAGVSLAGCGDDGSGRDGAETTITTSPAVTVIDVTVVAGDVRTADERVSVPSGDQVVITVTSDEPDELHVHGYDVSAPVTPGVPAEVAFDADITGVFEVELEGSGLVLVELAVS